MVFEEQRRILIVQAVALVTAMYAFMLSRLRMVQHSRPSISYAPMSVMDEERQRNMNLIYNCNDVECVNMLRMRRLPFFVCVSCLGIETCLEIAYIAVWKSKLPCFFMWLAITNVLELFTKPGGGM
jgi:hypothetical protein